MKRAQSLFQEKAQQLGQAALAVERQPWVGSVDVSVAHCLLCVGGKLAIAGERTSAL
jgi:hypothetical protein